jgi:tetraacyldisaccharide 4'-kinase
MTPERIAHLQNRFAPLLEPLSKGYAWLMRQRARLYLSGRFASWTPPAPCISVGNISWGGTGKTPVVSWLLDWARGEGISATVLTRGYGGKPPHQPFEVQLLSLPREAGDEPLLLKRTHPQARILVDPKRVRAGKFGARNQTDLFILDDGFQHLRVGRNLNLCLLCPRDLDEDWDRVLPAGTWREDVSALSRADAFLINTMFDDDGCLETVAHIKLASLGKPIFFFRVTARGVANALTGEALETLNGNRFILVTAIANPDKVCQTCKSDLGEKPVRHLVYPDHHQFTMADWRAIAEAAERNKCNHIVCTPKDAVKLASFADERLWVPQLTTSFSAAGHLPFRAWLDERIHISPRTPHAPEETINP